ncbi:putative 6-phosphofructo-2-kinase [Podosphaera aphanis]|nr:putative 6-phosphofructo-2-kinase [Podosphaera aphanis]
MSACRKNRQRAVSSPLVSGFSNAPLTGSMKHHDSNHVRQKYSDTTPPIASALDRALIAIQKAKERPAENEIDFSRSAPESPKLKPTRQYSGTVTPRVRPPATTLNIPGMTKSKISPDGKIAKRDVGAKLVVIMVGLPARGKSYITKKIQRYLSWQQHETKIFNVGNRRRIAAAASSRPNTSQKPRSLSPNHRDRRRQIENLNSDIDTSSQAAHTPNGVDPHEAAEEEKRHYLSIEAMEQKAEFFDPKNEQAAQFREKLAIQTLDELLDFLLVGTGSVGILDATNSTIERRRVLFNHIKQREPKINILFIESVCEDKKLLEANMQLKLRGPDYRGKDPEASLNDFRKRVAAYESAYVPVGDFEEDNKMQYIKMIDVGRKIVHHALQGFLATGIASYLSTFNLSPRQIWLTRHGRSIDNTLGKVGGDSDLTKEGHNYATALYNFVEKKRHEWEKDQKDRALHSMRFLEPGDQTPSNPEILGELEAKNFCVWTSMLKRSIQTGKEFDEDENYDVKHWEMLNEIHAGSFEGMTYQSIVTNHPEEYAKQANDKLGYIYPGVGGESYLQVISRLRDMVREIERIKDHVLIIGHRSICRVLMAYFMDLQREAIAELDVPLGMLFSIEPKPYGYLHEARRIKYKKSVVRILSAALDLLLMASNKRKFGAERPASKFYAVRVGVKPGVYETWQECQKQVTGFRGATFKAFSNYANAEAFVAGQPAAKKAKLQHQGTFYGVAVGRRPGIYTDWSEVGVQINGIKGARYKKFKTRADAELFVRSSGVDGEKDKGLEQTDEIVAADTDMKSIQKLRKNAPAGLEGNTLTLYTDGSSRGNGQNGARAGVGVYFGDNDPRNVSEPLKGMPQTNQRAELTAILRALQLCPASVNLRIYTDSSYSINCLTEWYKRWTRNGWKGASGVTVVNQDIIMAARSLMSQRETDNVTTDLIWVRGHQHDPGNEAADRLAVAGSESAHRKYRVR